MRWLIVVRRLVVLRVLIILQARDRDIERVGCGGLLFQFLLDMLNSNL